MKIVFEFVDGPLAARALAGDSAAERDPATALYRLTRQGAVGVRFIARSDVCGEATRKRQEKEPGDLGRRGEEYMYEVVERSEGEAEVRVRAKFVGKAVDGAFKASQAEGLA
jgi:hypothetical protein